MSWYATVGYALFGLAGGMAIMLTGIWLAGKAVDWLRSR